MKIRWGAAAALGMATALALAAPAHAQDSLHPAAAWQLRDIVTDWAPSAASTITDPGTAELVKPAGGGTSLETTNLGAEVTAGDEVSVQYELLDGASAAAGAVRLFVYDHPDADTLTLAPTAFVAAPDDGSTSGTLTISVPWDGQIGTAGLVYDASNAAGGAVRFSGLTVAGQLVAFLQPADPTPGPVPTGTTDPAPATDPPAGGSGGGADDGGQLPVTGDPVKLIGAGAGALLLVGGGLYVLARRRAVTFTA